MSTSSVVIPINLHRADEDLVVNDDPLHPEEGNVVRSLRALAPMMKASLREDNVGTAPVEGDMEDLPPKEQPMSSAYDGNVRRCLTQDFEDVEVNVDLNNDITKFVTKGSCSCTFFKFKLMTHCS